MDQDLKLLEAQRDRYFNGDWHRMLKELRYKARNRNAEQELKDRFREDYEKIEMHLGLRPKSGWKYYNGHCRFPGNFTRDKFERTKAILEEECDSWCEKNEGEKEDFDLYPAILALHEVLFLMNRSLQQNMYKNESQWNYTKEEEDLEETEE